MLNIMPLQQPSEPIPLLKSVDDQGRSLVYVSGVLKPWVYGYRIIDPYTLQQSGYVDAVSFSHHQTQGASKYKPNLRYVQLPQSPQDAAALSSYLNKKQSGGSAIPGRAEKYLTLDARHPQIPSFFSDQYKQAMQDPDLYAFDDQGYLRKYSKYGIPHINGVNLRSIQLTESIQEDARAAAQLRR
jgi:hypothetical protein